MENNGLVTRLQCSLGLDKNALRCLAGIGYGRRRLVDLFAGIMLFDALARLTANFATPHEPAMTSFDTTNFFHVVTTSTAQRLAALRAVRPPLTSPSAGPCHPSAGIRTTVVWRSIDMDEIGVGDGLAALALLSPAEGQTSAGKNGSPTARVERPGGGGAARTGGYLHRVLVFVFELVPDLAE